MLHKILKMFIKQIIKKYNNSFHNTCIKKNHHIDLHPILLPTT